MTNENQINLVGTKKFRLIPIGNIGFTFTKKSRMKLYEPMYFGDVSTSNETLTLSEEDEKRFVATMKKHKTDLFTDGHDFYTRYGNGIGKISHPYFEVIKEQHKEEIHKFIYG